MTEAWKLSLDCTREAAEAIASVPAEIAELDPPPVLVASEPDPARPDHWRIDAYFDKEPSAETLSRVAQLFAGAPSANLRAEPLPPEDWLSLSQAGFDPILAGRFRVRTPDSPECKGSVDFVIPAGLAFGTGQHATTAGCLTVIDDLKRRGAVFRNMLDLGTGTGLLAFAAMHCWPLARATASDIDPVSIRVVRENAALNRIALGIAPGRLMLAVADGLDNRHLIARSPYDLVIANILAQPLIDMAPAIAAAVAHGGTLILAGMLDTQSEAVMRAYRRAGMTPAARSVGEWPVLRLRKR